MTSDAAVRLFILHPSAFILPKMSVVTFGKYQIRRELGRGAMGIVYEATDPERPEPVALKIITVAQSGSPEMKRRQLARFYREAQALSELDHPRVVRLYEQGEIGGRSFFAMEKVSGTTLRDRLSFQGPLSLPELVRLSLELCDALNHIHSRCVVHRDIKPDNVMLLPDGGCKLMDFGIARQALDEDPKELGGFQGSPAYMSPEQVAGKSVDGRADIFSLGITLYEAATGRRAFVGDSVPVIVQKVVNEYPPPPAGLPPYFQAILLRAMAKNPAQRYASAGEMGADVAAARLPRQLGPVAAPPLAPPPPPYAPPPPVYLGADGVRPVAPYAVPPLGAPAPPSAPTAAPPPAAQAGPRAACRLHPRLAAVAACEHCGNPMCYTCMVEVPTRGRICRPCAYSGVAR
jgi:serine/threonine protein kinase